LHDASCCLAAAPRMKFSKQKLARIVRAMRGRRIGVVGDLMLDRYLLGSATRLSPESPVPVVDYLKEEAFPGGAGNVGSNLGALGAKVTLFGVVGDDEAGAMLRRKLAERGLPVQGLLTDAARITTLKTRIIARHQQIVRVDRERRAPLEKKLEDRLVRFIKSAVPKLEALVVSDYDKGVITDGLAERILDPCHRHRVPVFVKPKTSRLLAFRGAQAIVCNRQEAAFYVQRSALQDEEAVAQAGPELLARFGCAAAVITLGEKGMSVFEEGTAKGLHIPATSFEVTYARVGMAGLEPGTTGRQVFDVTGAGDTVLATLALAVSAGASMAEAAKLANLAAGVVVGKLGTATVTSGELLAAVREIRE